VCSEDYRGTHGFSEPETAAVRDFVETKKDILAMAFNFHAYGNLLIYPFNYDPSPSNNDLYQKYPDQALFFEEIT
jgi:carboxypeptidase T